MTAERRVLGMSDLRLTVGRPFGVPVHLSWTWLLIGGFVAVTTAQQVGPELGSGPVASAMIGIAFAVAIALSVLAHELGHTVISLALGIPIRRITLFIFGGYAEISRDSESPREEYLIAIAGPLVSLFLASTGIAVTAALPDTSAGAYLAERVAGLNVFLALLNLLPGLPLDGGRVLRALVWKLSDNRTRATQVAAVTGQLLAAVGVGLGMLLIDRGFQQDGVFTVIVAAFVWANAGTLRRQAGAATRLPTLVARTLARPVVSIEAGLPLAQALRQAEGVHGWPVVVDSYGRPVAILSAAAADAVPDERRPWIATGEVARTLDAAAVLPADLAGQGLVEALRDVPAGEYLLVDPAGAVTGVLLTADVVRALYDGAAK